MGFQYPILVFPFSSYQCRQNSLVLGHKKLVPGRCFEWTIVQGNGEPIRGFGEIYSFPEPLQRSFRPCKFVLVNALIML